MKFDPIVALTKKFNARCHNGEKNAQFYNWENFGSQC
jgi:hypothetical protein